MPRAWLTNHTNALGYPSDLIVWEMRWVAALGQWWWLFTTLWLRPGLAEQNRMNPSISTGNYNTLLTEVSTIQCLQYGDFAVNTNVASHIFSIGSDFV